MEQVFEGLGGRKFIGLVLMALIGGVVDVYSKTGLSTTMAGFLAGLYVTYSTANAVITHKSLDNEPEAVVSKSETGNNEEVAKLTAQIALTLGQIETSLNTISTQGQRSEQALNALQQSNASVQKAVGALLSSRQVE